MKIPEKVRLNGVDFAVQWIHDLNDGEHILDGQINYNYSLINLNSGTQGYQAQCITFLHEIFHGILQEYDCSRAGTDARIPKDEETLVETLARGMYQFLQDNGAALFDLERREATQKDGHSGTDTANAS